MSEFNERDYERFCQWLNLKIASAGKSTSPSLREAEIEFNMSMQMEEPGSFEHSVMTILRNYADYAVKYSKTGTSLITSETFALCEKWRGIGDGEDFTETALQYFTKEGLYVLDLLCLYRASRTGQPGKESRSANYKDMYKDDLLKAIYLAPDETEYHSSQFIPQEWITDPFRKNPFMRRLSPSVIEKSKPRSYNTASPQADYSSCIGEALRWYPSVNTHTQIYEMLTEGEKRHPLLRKEFDFANKGTQLDEVLKAVSPDEAKAFLAKFNRNLSELKLDIMLGRHTQERRDLAESCARKLQASRVSDPLRHEHLRVSSMVAKGLIAKDASEEEIKLMRDKLIHHDLDKDLDSIFDSISPLLREYDEYRAKGCQPPYTSEFWKEYVKVVNCQDTPTSRYILELHERSYGSTLFDAVAQSRLSSGSFNPSPTVVDSGAVSITLPATEPAIVDNEPSVMDLLKEGKLTPSSEFSAKPKK